MKNLALIGTLVLLTISLACSCNKENDLAFDSDLMGLWTGDSITLDILYNNEPFVTVLTTEYQFTAIEASIAIDDITRDVFEDPGPFTFDFKSDHTYLFKDSDGYVLDQGSWELSKDKLNIIINSLVTEVYSFSEDILSFGFSFPYTYDIDQDTEIEIIIVAKYYLSKP